MDHLHWRMLSVWHVESSQLDLGHALLIALEVVESWHTGMVDLHWLGPHAGEHHGDVGKVKEGILIIDLHGV